MQRLWSQLARTLLPYVPGEQPRLPGLLKLNTKECAYPPSPTVLSTIKETSAEALRLYPDPESLCLRRDLARAYKMTGTAKQKANGQVSPFAPSPNESRK